MPAPESPPSITSTIASAFDLRLQSVSLMREDPTSGAYSVSGALDATFLSTNGREVTLHADF